MCFGYVLLLAVIVGLWCLLSGVTFSCCSLLLVIGGWVAWLFSLFVGYVGYLFVGFALLWFTSVGDCRFLFVLIVLCLGWVCIDFVCGLWLL